MSETSEDQRTDLEILHAAGIEGSDATTQLRVLSIHDVWVPAVIGRNAMRAATVLSNAGRGKPMTETPGQQRARILAENPETKAWEYDLAVALGYEPESFDGMWKLTVNPFSYDDGKVIAREVTYQEGTIHPDVDEQGNIITREVRHPLPAGWNLLEDHKLTAATPTVRFVSPADQQWIKDFAATGKPPIVNTATNALAEDGDA